MFVALMAAGASEPPHELCDERFFFHQMLSGVDVAHDARSPRQERLFGLAKQMQNFMYLVGDAQAQDCRMLEPGLRVPGLSVRCPSSCVGVHCG